MNVSKEDIIEHREVLDLTRMEHEALLTKAQILRDRCQEIREICDRTSKEMLALIDSAKQEQRESRSYDT